MTMEQKENKVEDGKEKRVSETQMLSNGCFGTIIMNDGCSGTAYHLINAAIPGQEEWMCVALKLHVDTESGIKVLEELTINADQIQSQVLHQIISQNSKTEYLSRFLLHQDIDSNNLKQVFKERVPIVEYEDIRSYIQRVACGEPSHIICGQPITEFYTSSGTSGGQPKMIPTTVEGSKRRLLGKNLADAVVKKYVEGSDQGKAMSIVILKPPITTPSGLKAGSVLTSAFKSDGIQQQAITSPLETIFCSDTKQSMYCQILCSLVQREKVVRILAIFASSFLRVIKFLECNWKEMCSNIRTGQVSEWITDEDCRNAVSRLLDKPSPDLAHLIEMECDGGRSSWEGIVKRLWPRTKYIRAIVTGSMLQYVPTLEFYCDNIPLVSSVYISSECLFGINVNPLSKPSDVSYTLLPHMAYFEFIHLNKDKGKDDTLMQNSDGGVSTDQVVDLVDVQVGHYYELLVTTFAGLYRYRVGDILMVTGFHNKAPQFRFVERKNVVLSIDVEKTSEDDLLKAITQAKLPIEQLGFHLSDYTSYADTSSIPGHYVLFWELIKKNDGGGKVEMDPVVMEECCSKVEEMLDLWYRKFRVKDKSIGPLEIRVVKQGTFDQLMDYHVAKGASANQYKTARCVTNEEAIGILDSGVVGKYFSKKVPSWEPFQVLAQSSE